MNIIAVKEQGSQGQQESPAAGCSRGFFVEQELKKAGNMYWNFHFQSETTLIDKEIPLGSLKYLAQN